MAASLFARAPHASKHVTSYASTPYSGDDFSKELSTLWAHTRTWGVLLPNTYTYYITKYFLPRALRPIVVDEDFLAGSHMLQGSNDICTQS